MRCSAQHAGHKTMDSMTAKFSMVLSRSQSDPNSTRKDTFISSSRAEAMQDEAGYALAMFRRTVSSEKITNDAKKAKLRMDSESQHLKTALNSIDSTMSAAARTIQEAGRWHARLFFLSARRGGFCKPSPVTDLITRKMPMAESCKPGLQGSSWSSWTQKSTRPFVNLTSTAVARSTGELLAFQSPHATCMCLRAAARKEEIQFIGSSVTACHELGAMRRRSLLPAL